MYSVVNYDYSEKGLKDIAEWAFGKNWPSVYIIYNDQYAYVGETLDAVRRTEQHLQETKFNDYSSICLISNKTFNKSVILDLESYLIKYMGSDGTRKLVNGNAGIVDHDYFYREAYSDDFKEIWNMLKGLGIVSKSIIDIENSEIYKYSPYKSLNIEQQKTAFSILKSIYQINNASKKSMLTVYGGAGTGKTILAVYLVKLLVDLINKKHVWNSIDDSEDSAFIEKLSGELYGINNIGFVVPMVELRNTMKAIFNSVDGLDESMILSPKEVVNKRYDILIVDEAHRLYQRKFLPGSHLYVSFDKINKELMGDDFVQDESAFTELDWIIKSSRIQVLFYDEFQAIRTADIGRQRFEEICKPHLFKYFTLFSQMRCKGGNGYYEYIKKILESEDLQLTEYQSINDYTIKVFDNVSSLISTINEFDQKNKLCKTVTGPGWGINEDIIIDKEVFRWANGRNDDNYHHLYSIHKIQGFDLNYAGVIFGKEIYYNTESKRIEINKQELRDNFTKGNGDDYTRRYILNIYITLMTRGINGTFVYAMDDNLRDYLKTFLG